MSGNDSAMWPFVPFGSDKIDTLRIVKTKGSYLYSDKGQKILDASAGAAVGNIGWGRKEVAEVSAKALKGMSYALPPFITEEREHLVSILSEKWLPTPLNKVCFMGSGSEAVDNAIRLARQYHLANGRTEKWKIIGRDVSYHGTSLAGLAVGGHAARRQEFEPMLMHAPHLPACYCLRCPMNKEPQSCSLECAEHLEQIIHQAGSHTISAIIIEPIVGASGGAIVPPDGYLPTLAKICKHHEILLIADEVMTGFGRTGDSFAVNHWRVIPDILVLGKGLSGGYASISALATSTDFCQQLTAAGIQPMYHTYGAHPAACAVSAKVLEIIHDEQLLLRVKRMSPTLSQKLKQLELHPNVAQVRGMGFLYGIEVVKNSDTLERFSNKEGITLKIFEACLKRNCLVYFGGTGVVRDIILIAPHFIINEEEIDTIVNTLKLAINEVCNEILRSRVNYG